MKTKLKPANPLHEQIYQDIAAVMKKYGDQLSSEDVLAILSNMVGKCVAMQDQRKYTPEAIMKIVAMNIQYGNQHVIDELMNAPGERT